ncbi:MAG TPA: prepilin-type N-terminal cleavage/methylation domain-containing protein [Patescibacteria group bacterium]|nr:prepilin-type N-terminal cleavage/methylation domain-containing protein [Patescibacteria group bacterium]
MRNSSLKDQGFTLMEIMVTMGIFIVIILVTGSLYALAQNSYNIFEGRMELVQNGRVAYDRMSREIRQSVEIATPLTPGMSTTSKEIMFQNGHDNSNINYIYYYLDGSDLRRAKLAYYFEEEPNVYVKYSSVNEDGDSPQQKVLQDRVVGEYFKEMEFWGENGLVHASTTLENKDKSFSLQSSIFSRNY